MKPIRMNRLGMESMTKQGKWMPWEAYWGHSSYNGFTRIHAKDPKREGKEIMFECVFMTESNSGCLLSIIEHARTLAANGKR